MWKPIVPTFSPAPAPLQVQRAHYLAEQYLRDRPYLSIPAGLKCHALCEPESGPALHLDDLGEIRLLGGQADADLLGHRARLRAGDGDWIASCACRVDGYDDYCAERLGLGRPSLLRPRGRRHPLRTARACWIDRSVRRILIREVRAGRLRLIHPHMSVAGVWQLANLLQRSARRPLFVLGPHPALCRQVNDKVSFAGIVRRLFGAAHLPPTTHAASRSALAVKVRDLAEDYRSLTLKIPDAAGGRGNAVLDSSRFRGRSLLEIGKELVRPLRRIGWSGTARVLVGAWESAVLAAPSVQLWIVPRGWGAPVIEGVFDQALEGGEFRGVRLAPFPDSLFDELTERSCLLGCFLQHLGYTGRCSFDTVLVGASYADCSVKFVECNGRWGGCSLPMTLMNRLFGHWVRQPYSTFLVRVPGLDELCFRELLELLEDELYDARRGTGRAIVFSPGRMRRQSSIGLLGLGSTWEEAERYAMETLPARLRRRLAARRSGRRPFAAPPGASEQSAERAG